MDSSRAAALAMSVAAFVFLAGGAARAADPEPPAEAEQGAPQQVTLKVMVVAASPKPGPTDPQLDKLRRRLSDFNFASYRVLSTRTLTLGLASVETLPLPGNRTLEVKPRKFEKSGKLRVRLRVRNEKQVKLVDADYAIEPGGDLLVGGMDHEDGKLLIAIQHG